MNLTTTAKITWCPGCPNSQILVALRQTLNTMVEKGELKIENVVACVGIGCHGKISDYININTFTSLHGRLIPAMTGIKMANKNLTVIGMSGDGDSYSEGLEHLVHAARRNSDVKLFIHDNQVFALTTGQTSAASPRGHISKTTPFGSIEDPLDPFPILLHAGATFVARTYAGEIAKTAAIMEKAIKHKGFAFVEIIQPCITFFDTRDYFKDKVFWIDREPASSVKEAIDISEKKEDKVPLGVFYEVSKATFEEQLNG